VFLPKNGLCQSSEGISPALICEFLIVGTAAKKEKL
jgi:hypothetical protein